MEYFINENSYQIQFDNHRFVSKRVWFCVLDFLESMLEIEFFEFDRIEILNIFISIFLYIENRLFTTKQSMKIKTIFVGLFSYYSAISIRAQYIVFLLIENSINLYFFTTFCRCSLVSIRVWQPEQNAEPVTMSDDSEKENQLSAYIYTHTYLISKINKRNIFFFKKRLFSFFLPRIHIDM